MRQKVESDPQRDRLRVQLPVRQRHRERGRRQRSRLQQGERRLRAVRRRGPLLRGHEGQGVRCRVGVHRAGSRNPPQRARSSRPSGSRSSEPDAVLEPPASPWPDHRAERTLGAVSLPSCVHRRGDGRVRRDARVADLRSTTGCSWLGSGGDLGTARSPTCRTRAFTRRRRRITCSAWPLIYGTLLTTSVAVVLGAGDLDLLLDLHRRARARRGCAGSRSR